MTRHVPVIIEVEVSVVVELHVPSEADSKQAVVIIVEVLSGKVVMLVEKDVKVDSEVNVVNSVAVATEMQEAAILKDRKVEKQGYSKPAASRYYQSGPKINLLSSSISTSSPEVTSENASKTQMINSDLSSFFTTERLR